MIEIGWRHNSRPVSGDPNDVDHFWRVFSRGMLIAARCGNDRMQHEAWLVDSKQAQCPACLAALEGDRVGNQ